MGKKREDLERLRMNYRVKAAKRRANNWRTAILIETGLD